MTPVEAMPQGSQVRGLYPVFYEGLVYKHFSGGEATTTFVLGEFPWRVKVGEAVVAHDYINPPYVLSSETTRDEITWSRGEYVPGAVIWKAFSLQGSPPYANGVYLNCGPAPMELSRGNLAKLGIMVANSRRSRNSMFSTLSKNETVLHKSYTFAADQEGEPRHRRFRSHGSSHHAGAGGKTNLDNNWGYFNFALVNQDTGAPPDFGREVSYYSGSDSDGPWTEGLEELVRIGAVSRAGKILSAC